DGEKYFAWYDQDGTWIGTAYVVNDFSKLPAYVNASITKQYPGFTITNVNREIHNDRTVYEVVLKSSTNKIVLLMDTEGTILKYKSKPL
ncbi:MAG: PepSY-like domain-containing protein, partial [Bacteroidota bacterium]